VIRVNHENTNSLKVPLRCGFTNTGEVIIERGEELIVFVKRIDG